MSKLYIRNKKVDIMKAKLGHFKCVKCGTDYEINIGVFVPIPKILRSKHGAKPKGVKNKKRSRKI